jgi:hypothetical protein
LGTCTTTKIAVVSFDNGITTDARAQLIKVAFNPVDSAEEKSIYIGWQIDSSTHADGPADKICDPDDKIHFLKYKDQDFEVLRRKK